MKHIETGYKGKFKVPQILIYPPEIVDATSFWAHLLFTLGIFIPSILQLARLPEQDQAHFQTDLLFMLGHSILNPMLPLSRTLGTVSFVESVSCNSCFPLVESFTPHAFPREGFITSEHRFLFLCFGQDLMLIWLAWIALDNLHFRKVGYRCDKFSKKITGR